MSSSKPNHHHHSQHYPHSYATQPKLGRQPSPNHSPSTTDSLAKTTPWKLHQDLSVFGLSSQYQPPSQHLPAQHPPLCPVLIDLGNGKPVPGDSHTKPDITNLHSISQLHTSPINTQYTPKNSLIQLSQPYASPIVSPLPSPSLSPSPPSSPPRSRRPTRESPYTRDPLPSIWSKVFPLPSKQEHEHFRPHAELLLHLRSLSGLPPSPPSPPSTLQASTTHTTRPYSIHALQTSPIQVPPTAQGSPITPYAHHRPRRANDYTGEFKREFCALLSKHANARAQWEHFWRRRECTGRRPCIRSYLAFCDLFTEFAMLRRIHKYRVLGTRTNCECSYPSYAIQRPTSRFYPY